MADNHWHEEELPRLERRRTVLGASRAIVTSNSNAVLKLRKRRNILFKFALYCVFGAIQISDTGSDISAAASYFGAEGRDGSYSVPGIRVQSTGNVEILLEISSGSGTFLSFTKEQLTSLGDLAKQVRQDGLKSNHFNCKDIVPSIVNESVGMSLIFDVAYAAHAVVSIVVSTVVFHRLCNMLLRLWNRYNRLDQERIRRAALLSPVIKIQHDASEESESTHELQDEFETEEMRLKYRRAAMLMFALEDVPCIFLTLWRIIAIALNSSMRLSSLDQNLLLVQFFTSAIMAGLRIANLNQYIKDDNEQRKFEARLADAMAKTRSIIEGFVGVLASDVRRVVGIRRVLNTELAGKARDIAGDVVLLRHLRAVVRTSTNYLRDLHKNEERLVILAAKRMNDALVRREVLGADIVRERILRDDMSFNTLPDEDLLQAAFPHNMNLGFDRNGSIVQFEAWGSVDIKTFHEMSSIQGIHTASSESLKRFSTKLDVAWLYRTELQNILLVELMHKSYAIRHVTLLVDVAGIDAPHAKLADFLHKRQELCALIYPDSIKDVVLANVSTSATASRVLSSLGLPDHTLYVNSQQSKLKRPRPRNSVVDVAGIRKSSLFGLLSAARTRKTTKSQSQRIRPEHTTKHNTLDTPMGSEVTNAIQMAIGAQTREEFFDWHQRMCSDELNLHLEENTIAWRHLQIPGSRAVKAEWRPVTGTPYRLHRVRTRLNADARVAFKSSVATLGTPQSCSFGDMDVLEQKILGRLVVFDQSLIVIRHRHRMHQFLGKKERDFLSLVAIDEEHLMIVSKDLKSADGGETLLKHYLPSLGVLGHVHKYGWRFQQTDDGQCLVSLLFCLYDEGNRLSVQSISDTTSVAVCEGLWGVTKVMQVLASEFEKAGVDGADDIDSYLLEDLHFTASAKDSGLMAFSSQSLRESDDALQDYFDSSILPVQLGGSLELGENGRCCAGVYHQPISSTLGRAGVVRTFTDVSEDECQLVGIMMKGLESGDVGESLKVSDMPPHVGGDIVLLRTLRSKKNDIDAAIMEFIERQKRREKLDFDEVYAHIMKSGMSFSEVPGNEELQHVWPHNWDIGRTASGDIIRYERYGAIDVDGLLDKFPLNTSSMASSTVKVEGSLWMASLEDESGVDFSIMLQNFDTELSDEVDDLLASVLDERQRLERMANALATAGLGDFVSTKTNEEKYNLADGEDAEWTQIVQGIHKEVFFEYRTHPKMPKLRQYRYVIKLPEEILGEYQSPEAWFEAAMQSIHSDNFMVADRESERFVVLSNVDDFHSVLWTAISMPTGISDRDFASLSFADYDRLSFSLQSLSGQKFNSLVSHALGLGDYASSLVRAHMHLKGFAIKKFDSGRGCRIIFHECVDPVGIVASKLLNRDRVCRARARDFYKMAKALVASRERLVNVSRFTSSESYNSPAYQMGLMKKRSKLPSFRANIKYRTELNHVLHDNLSRKLRRVVTSVNLIDVKGLTVKQRRIVPYIFEELHYGKVGPDVVSVLLIPSVTTLTTSIFNGFKRLLPDETSSKIIFLNTSGTGLSAEEAKIELLRRIPRRVLPMSLGGDARFGTNGDCCVGVQHKANKTDSISPDDEIEAATAFLERFSDALPGEIMAVLQLSSSDLGAELLLQPPHIGGGVALLRLERSLNMSAFERGFKMLNVRKTTTCSSNWKKILDEKWTLHTLPGAHTASEATFEANDWIGLDSNQDVVVYERWGAVDPAALVNHFTIEEFLSWDSYRWEARAMVLDTLSRRSQRVVCFAFVVDAAGMGLEHRRLAPYFKAHFNAWHVPELRSATFIVRAGSVFRGFFTLMTTMGAMSDTTEHIRRDTIIIHGPEPLVSSKSFAARFGRWIIPTTLGGDLQTGTDVHCCKGVELPAVADEDALWKLYERQSFSGDEDLHSALQLLAEFSGLRPSELSQVCHFFHSELGAATQALPWHLSNHLSILRLFRHPTISATDWTNKMLSVRRKLKSTAKSDEILYREMSQHTLPGSERLKESNWKMNDFIGVDVSGHILVYESWGTIEPATLCNRMPVEAFSEWNAYRWEARAMVIGAISRREDRVVYFSNVINMTGATLEFRKLIPYFKEYAIGDAVMSVPELRHMTYIVGRNKATATFWSIAKTMKMVNEHHAESCMLIDGCEPRESSDIFRTRIRRDHLPVALGGTLKLFQASIVC